MKVVLIFLQKYWKQILLVIGGLIVFRKIRAATNTNVMTNVYPTMGATITNQQAKAYAQRLYQAMESFGTDEDAIDEVFGLIQNNPYNLRAVYNEFANRDYGSFGSPAFFNVGTPTDLKGWVTNELSGKRLDQWRALFALANIV